MSFSLAEGEADEPGPLFPHKDPLCVSGPWAAREAKDTGIKTELVLPADTTPHQADHTSQARRGGTRRLCTQAVAQRGPAKRHTGQPPASSKAHSVTNSPPLGTVSCGVSSTRAKC